jgi:hypothetical protein
MDARFSSSKDLGFSMGQAVRLTLIITVIAQLLIAPAFAQDRPLFQPFRISFPISGSFGDRLMADDTLDRDLRRIGLIASWHSFEEGLMALRALHAEEVDIALDIGQHDAILGKLENLGMVFVAERTVRDNSDADQIFPDDQIKRYTLASEYIADRREDALRLVFRALQDAARPIVQSDTNRPGHHFRVMRSQAQRDNAYEVDIATRRLLSVSQRAVDELWASGRILRRVDFADVNYWIPPPDFLPPAASQRSRPDSR